MDLSHPMQSIDEGKALSYWCGKNLLLREHISNVFKTTIILLIISVFFSVSELIPYLAFNASNIETAYITMTLSCL